MDFTTCVCVHVLNKKTHNAIIFFYQNSNIRYTMFLMDRKIFIRLPNPCRHIRCWQASTPKLTRNCWLRCTEIKYTYWLFTGKSIIYWKIKHMHFVRRLICWLFFGLVEYRLLAYLYNSIFKNVYIFFYLEFPPPPPPKRKVGPFCFTSHFFRGGWVIFWLKFTQSFDNETCIAG